MNNFYFIILLSLIAGCKQYYAPLEDEEELDRKAVARALDIQLYEDDLAGLVPLGSSEEDSSLLMGKYIDSWIKKQLMIERASKEMDFDEANIERKVLDYRYALMVHEFEKYYINKHLDKEITDEEINTYYQEKFENFILRQNIVRCLFAVIPAEAPKVADFRIMIRTYPNSDMDEIQSYCYRFASKSSLEVDLWLNFDEIIASTPMANVQDKATFLKSNSFVEMSDEENYYFIRLLDYKISDQISPLEYIKDDIESILINKKKIELRKELEDKIYNSAKNKNEFEIYN